MLYNILTLAENTFQCNTAGSGGVLYAYAYNTLTFSGNVFADSSADKDGGVLVIRRSTTNLTNNTLCGNMASIGGAVLCLSNSNISIQGSHNLQNNKAKFGGGIAAIECQIIIVGDFRLESNKASLGGGLYLEKSNTSGCGYFSNNSASEYGGGIYASESTLYFNEGIIFDRNSALNGGGLLLAEDSVLYLQPNTTIMFTNNSAGQRGGAIKVEDTNPLQTCPVNCHSSMIAFSKFKPKDTMKLKSISPTFLSYKMSQSTSQITQHLKQVGHYMVVPLTTAVLTYLTYDFNMNSSNTAAQGVVKCLSTSPVQTKNTWMYRQTHCTYVPVKTVSHTAVPLPLQDLYILEVK